MAELHDGYRLEDRGDRFDLVHISLADVAGRRMAVREIIRANIPAAEIRALKEQGKSDA